MHKNAQQNEQFHKEPSKEKQGLIHSKSLSCFVEINSETLNIVLHY